MDSGYIPSKARAQGRSHPRTRTRSGVLQRVVTPRHASLLALSLALCACGESSSTAPDASVDVAADAPAADVTAADVRSVRYTAPPASVVIEPGVRREAVLVDTPAAPVNPATRAATPAALNRVRVMRYRSDSATPQPARSIVVAMPGFLGGAGSFDPLARALVKRGAAAMTPVEVWVIDRRSNLLEDLRGMDVADAMRDPDVAAGYYLRRDLTLDGAAFEGYLGASDPSLSYMAEWGIASLVRDVKAVIDRVPAPRSHVVLLGHSLGASIVEAFAAWDFDGVAGYRSLAGLAMIDGVAGGTSVTEAQYLTAGVSGPGGFGSASLSRLRSAGPYFVALPFLGVRALVVSEIVARRAAVAPDAVVADPDRDSIYQVLLGVRAMPPLTNAAAFGFGFDEASCPLAFARMSVGAPAGGALRMAPNAFDPTETLTAPASETDTYRWTDAPAATPREFTPLANGIAAWSATPTNFSEWYFPSRLSLDASALGDMSLAASAWQVREGIRVMHGREVDVPVLGVAAALTGSAAVYERVRGRVAATVGADLPAAGANRADVRAFLAVHVPRMTHIDPISGADGNPDNPVPELLFNFATASTAGTVTPTL